MKTKICKTCLTEKYLEDFYVRSDRGLGGRRASCKNCENKVLRKKRNTPEHRQKMREYCKQDYVKEKLHKSAKERWVNNEEVRDKYYKYMKSYRKRDYVQKKLKEQQEKQLKKLHEKLDSDPIFRKKYYDRIRAYNRKRREDPIIRLHQSVSRKIRQSLDGTKKGRKWETLVGYSLEQLKEHLEKQFLPGMTWDNYGQYGWHMDHIIPISIFKIKSNTDQSFKDCWALSNLRPLWWKDNIEKGNKILPEFQQKFGECDKGDK